MTVEKTIVSLAKEIKIKEIQHNAVLPIIYAIVAAQDVINTSIYNIQNTKAISL